MDRKIYDHEAEGHLNDPEEQLRREHDDCEHPPFPGNTAGELAAFAIWMYRHATRVHGEPRLDPSERAFVREFRGLFDLDLDDDATRAVIIKLATGGLMAAGNMAGVRSHHQVHTVFMNLMQGIALEAAEWEMGQDVDA